MIRFNPAHIVFCLLPVVSCGRNEGSMPFSEVNFVISVPQGVAPASMRMLLFDPGSGSFAGDVNLNGRTEENFFKAVAELRNGTYDAICYNPDMPDTFVSAGKDKSGMNFYTESVSSDILARCGYIEGQSLHHTPDAVYGAVLAGVSPGSHQSGSTASADCLVETWNIVVNGDGLQYAQAAGAVISGFPVTLHPFNSPVDVSGDLWTKLSISGDSVTGTFNVFKGSTDSGHSIVFNILDNNGKPYLFPLDCTETISEARRNGTMTISPEASIVIPKPETTGTEGGFLPELGEWNHQTGEFII